MKNLLTKRKQNNDLVSRCITQRQPTKIEREKHAVFIFQEFLNCYVVPLEDIAFDAIDELYETYKTNKTFLKDENLMQALTYCNNSAKRRYNDLLSIVKDTEFYADMLDGAHEYFKPTFSQMYEDYKILFRGAGAKYYKLNAMLSCVQTIAQFAKSAVEKFMEKFRKQERIVFNTPDMYIMTEELQNIYILLDKFSVPDCPILKPSIDLAYKHFTDAVMPQKFVTSMRRYVLQYHPERQASFNRMIKSVFNI